MSTAHSIRKETAADAAPQHLMPMGEMAFAFDITKPADWDALLERVPHSNLLQSFAYGRAIRATRQLMPRFARITVGGEAVGCFQIQEAKLFGLHAIVLDRGPLWFERQVPALWWRNFFDVFAAKYPPRFGRWRRVMPELDDNDIHHRLVTQAGFALAKPDMTGHRSIWIDLTRADESLEADMRANWRQSLKAAVSRVETVEFDARGTTLAWLLARYVADRRERKYPGPAPQLLKILAETAFTIGKGLIIRALKKGEPIAAILILSHGRQSTYQVGWTSEEGRAANAHHLLLWRAIHELRQRGMTALDLGGINPEQAEGVTKFKIGLGGTPYQLLAIYR